MARTRTDEREGVCSEVKREIIDRVLNLANAAGMLGIDRAAGKIGDVDPGEMLNVAPWGDDGASIQASIPNKEGGRGNFWRKRWNLGEEIPYGDIAGELYHRLMQEYPTMGKAANTGTNGYTRPTETKPPSKPAASADQLELTAPNGSRIVILPDGSFAVTVRCKDAKELHALLSK
jgi:hypothetical protein